MKICSQWAVLALTGVALSGKVLAASAQPIELKGTEYPLTLRSVGDQVHSRLALGDSGGLVLWQDAAIDGQGLGIAALRLTSTFSPDPGGAFQVNQNSLGDQENVAVALMPGKGAFFVWQAGEPGFPRIFGRVMGPDGTFLTGDIAISGEAGEHQLDPAVVRLSDDEVVVTWASYRQDGDHYNVFARRFTKSGEPIGPEFRVNQSLGLGRRSPAVAARPDGGFLIVWVAERQVGTRDNRDVSGRTIPGTGSPRFEVVLYSRAFDGDGNPASDEKPVSGVDGLAAHPALAPLPNGEIVVAWSRRDSASRSNSFDIARRVLSLDGTAHGSIELVNVHRFGDQYQPRLAATGRGVFAVWSSLGQDGSWEGVYGRWMDAHGNFGGDELQINTTTAGGQIHPSVSSSPSGDILVAWSMNLPRTGMEIFAQSLSSGRELPAPGAPMIAALSSSTLMASWPLVSSFEVGSYRVFAANGEQLAELTGNHWKKDQLAPSTSMGFQIAYVLKTGEVSPRSPIGSGTTWGQDNNFDGLPDDWQAAWWPGASKVPGGGEDSDADGMTNLEEWLAGTNPVNAASRLEVSATLTHLGLRLSWVSQPGFVYQLQSSGNGKEWKDAGGPRFAAGNSDAMTLPATADASFFRVLRVR